MVLLLWSLVGWGAVPMPCGTPAHMTEFLSVERLPVGPPVSDLRDHESHGSIPNVRYSDRFALKWGPSFDLSEADAERILNDFDYALTAQVDDWEMPDPTGVGGTYFNVYIGDSGGAVPSALGNAGYFTGDEFGYPMIVLSKDILGDPSYARSVIAHEFFHAVQYASGAFYDWDTAAWYWEATATWVQGEVVPENTVYASFLVFYALQPHVGLYHHSMNDFDSSPPDLHQYGAFIFPRYLSEHMGAAEAVRDSWRNGGEYDDPVRILREQLGEPTFNAALVNHAAHNLTWDYADSSAYRDWVETYAGWWPERDYRINGLNVTDDPDWYEPANGLTLAPASYGLMPVPQGWSDDGLITVRIEENASSGSNGSKLIGRLIQLNDGAPTYVDLSDTAVHDTVEVDPSAELWLAVANVASIDQCPEPVPFRVSFLRRDDPVDTGSPDDTANPDDTGAEGPDDRAPPDRPTALAHMDSTTEFKGCSCATQGSRHGTVWLLLLPLLAYRRKDTAHL